MTTRRRLVSCPSIGALSVVGSSLSRSGAGHRDRQPTGRSIIVPGGPGGVTDIRALAGREIDAGAGPIVHRREPPRRRWRQSRHPLRAPAAHPMATRWSSSISARWAINPAPLCQPGLRPADGTLSHTHQVGPQALAVDVPARTVAELLALAKASPAHSPKFAGRRHARPPGSCLLMQMTGMPTRVPARGGGRGGGRPGRGTRDHASKDRSPSSWPACDDGATRKTMPDLRPWPRPAWPATT